MARDHASGGGEQGLIYAALELRFCMEAVAYRQLSTYNEQIRSQLSKEWNPSRIIRTLALFDELSDQTAEFSIAVDPPADLTERLGDEPNSWVQGLEFLVIGNAYRIPWKQFGRVYSTLGSFLHLDKTANNLYPKLEKLEKVFAILDQVADSTLIAGLNNIAATECQCGSTLVIGPIHQRGESQINCANKACNAVYTANPNVPNVISPVPGQMLTCPCGANVPFERTRMLGVHICPSCHMPVRARINKQAVKAGGISPG